MTKSQNRFVFEHALPQDGKEISTILEDAAFQGNISLLYTRRPDAYQSFKQEGQEVDIVVARDMKKKKIAGFGACALRKLFINGKIEKVGYLFSLRIAREYMKKSLILHRGYNYLHNLHKNKDVACYMTTILEENRYVQQLLEKPRSFMPTYQPFGRYEIFAMRTVPQSSLVSSSLYFRQAENDDVPALVGFLNGEGRNYQFSPVIDEVDLRTGQFNGLTIRDFYLLCSEDAEILAAGVPWDQRQYKQYIMQGYGGILKILHPFSRIFSLFGYPALPVPGSILHFFTLAFWAVKDNDPEIFRRFLNKIMEISRNYPFFLVGLHERHPLRSVLRQRPHISYRSKVYLVFWNEQREFVKNLHKEILPYLECGML